MSMNMDSINMSGSSTSSSADSSGHNTMGMMTFHSGMGDSLWVASFAPSSGPSYFGALILLVALGVLYRSLYSLAAYVEAVSRRRMLLYANELNSASPANTNNDSVSKDAVGGVSPKRVTSIIQSRASTSDFVTVALDPLENPAWRWSVDMPRALIQVLATGIGYLLMLAVMTGNIGYFIAVLFGIFFGELLFGRFCYAARQARALTCS
jgi:hypothetical protein